MNQVNTITTAGIFLFGLSIFVILLWASLIIVQVDDENPIITTGVMSSLIAGLMGLGTAFLIVGDASKKHLEEWLSIKITETNVIRRGRKQ